MPEIGLSYEENSDEDESGGDDEDDDTSELVESSNVGESIAEPKVNDIGLVLPQ